MHVAPLAMSGQPCGTDEEAMDEEATDEEATDEETTDEEATFEEATDEEATDVLNGLTALEFSPMKCPWFYCQRRIFSIGSWGKFLRQIEPMPGLTLVRENCE